MMFISKRFMMFETKKKAKDKNQWRLIKNLHKTENRNIMNRVLY